MPIDYGLNNVITSGNINVSGIITATSGNFNSLRVNGTGISISGHTHSSSNITDFNSSVSGLLPTISNSGNNKILTSTGSSVGINAENNLTFDGTTFVCSGSALIGDGQYLDVSNGVISIRNPDGTPIFSAEESLFFDSNNATVSLDYNSRYLYDSAQAIVLSWYQSGKIGIRNNDPIYTLDVNGSGNFASGVTVSNQTANTIASFDGSKNVVSLPTGTYPSLTELSYVKNVTSNIQTQLNNKQNSLTNPVTGTGVTNHIAYWNSFSGIVADSGQLVWDAANNRLGLGIIAPSSIFHISQNDAILTIGDSSTNAGAGPRLELNSLFGATSTSAYLGYSYYNNGTYLQHGRVGVGGIRLNSANGTTRLYVQDSNGNVGINTTNPLQKLDVSGNANIDGNLVFDSFTESVVAIGNSSTSQTLLLDSGTVQTCTLTNNCVFTMPTATAGKSFTMFLNTGSGNYVASFSGVLWSDSAPPTITTTASKVDILSFMSDGTYWYGSYSQNYG